MPADRDIGRGVSVVSIAIAVAIAGYLPAAFVYDRVTSWLRPMRHPEEAMGRGLEVIMIGGPLGALMLASIAGWLVFRCNSRVTIAIAMAAIVGSALASVIIARLEGLI